jgi:transposase
MANSFLPYGPEQVFLLPPSPVDWLPEDHLAYQMLDIVGELDMSPFLSGYSDDGRGAPAFSPYMMVSLILYAWVHRVYSSRKVELLCFQDVGARVICGGNLPDHRSINRFRTRHDKVLANLFDQSIRLCQRAGMVSLSKTAVDGSKIEANASKRKAMSYARMVTDEEKIKAEIEGYFRRAAEEDAADDALYGPDKTGRELPEHLRRRQDRLAKIREAKAALEAEAKAAAEAKEKEREAKLAAASGKLAGKKPKIDPVPKPTAQKSFTDPESRIMKNGKGAFIQGYNGQIAVDADHQVIVACALSQQAADVVHMVSVVEQVIDKTGCKPGIVMADGGYFSTENMQALDKMGVNALIPPDRERCGTPDKPAPPLTPDELAALKPIDQMRHRVSTAEGRENYAKRKTIVEPVFGQTKGSTGNPGFTGFLRRGLEKCDNEWHLVCACHNILKYIRFKSKKQHGEAAPKNTRILAKPAIEGQFQTAMALQ